MCVLLVISGSSSSFDQPLRAPARRPAAQTSPRRTKASATGMMAAKTPAALSTPQSGSRHDDMFRAMTTDNGIGFLGIGHDESDDEIGPRGNEDEDPGREEPVPGERQDDLGEDRKRRGAVDDGRLFEISRKLAEEPLEDPNSEGQQQTGIDDDQPRPACRANQRPAAPCRSV